MPRISKEDRDAKALDLVSMWLGQDDQWMSYAEIKNEAVEHKGFNKRTLRRYLDWLIETNVLESEQLSERKRVFRPTQQYWKKYFKWIPITPEANDSEYLYFIKLASELTKTFDGTFQHLARQGDEARIGKGLSRKELNGLNSLTANLIRSIRLGLSRDYFNKESTPEAAYALLRENVERSVKAYLALWAFLAETCGSREIFSKQMSRVQRSVKRMKSENP